MYATIVVGIDGSATAEIALGRAVDLARLTGATLHVVSAYEPNPAHVSGGSSSKEFSVGSDFKADAALQSALSRVRGENIEVHEYAPKGSPADAILATANEQGADVIVIGNVGMQGARRVLGSVPNKVSHQASCDVIIVQTR